jgi:hypothetical protein
MSDFKTRSVGDVPAPMHEKYLPITHFDVMLAKVGEALKEYEEDWRKGCANSATSHAEYEREAVVKRLRDRANSAPQQAAAWLLSEANAIEKGEHL